MKIENLINREYEGNTYEFIGVEKDNHLWDLVARVLENEVSIPIVGIRTTDLSHKQLQQALQHLQRVAIESVESRITFCFEPDSLEERLSWIGVMDNEDERREKLIEEVLEGVEKYENEQLSACFDCGVSEVSRGAFKQLKDHPSSLMQALRQSSHLQQDDLKWMAGQLEQGPNQDAYSLLIKEYCIARSLAETPIWCKQVNQLPDPATQSSQFLEACATQLQENKAQWQLTLYILCELEQIVCKTQSLQADAAHLLLKTPYPQHPKLFEMLERVSAHITANEELKLVGQRLADLTKLQKQFAEEVPYYIPLRADYSRKGEGKDLKEHVDEFLASDKKILLIQGDSGSGKTCAALDLHINTLKTHPDITPHYIRLAQIHEKTLRDKLEEIQPDKKELVLFILDGYDEINCHENLYSKFCLGDWENGKVIFTSRTQHLKEGYTQNFVVKGITGSPNYQSLMELYLHPLSDQEVTDYLTNAATNTEWNTQLYQEKLDQQPQLKELAQLPFIANILGEILPDLGDKATRLQIYETFCKKRFQQERIALSENVDIETDFEEFSMDLALEMFSNNNCYTIELKKKKAKVNRFRKPMQNTFEVTILEKLLKGDDEETAKARRGCLIRKLEKEQYEFLHPSIRDYFIASALFQCLFEEDHDEVDNDDNLSPLGLGFISQTPEIIDFLAYMYWDNTFIEKMSPESIEEQQHESIREIIKDQLFSMITASRNKDDQAVVKASSNASTILARAGIAFSGKDLSGVHLDQANLNGGIFHHTNMQGAILHGATMQSVQLVHANLRKANLDEVELGEMVTLKPEDEVYCIAYHPTKHLCAVGLRTGKIQVWDTDRAKRITTLQGHVKRVMFVCYSPDGRRLLSASADKTVRQWPSTGGAATEIFWGHEYAVTCVCYSPDGKRILSGSWDRTVCQWPSTGGEATEIFRGHETCVTSVCYSPDGKHLLSGSYDNTVHQWQSTGGAATEIFRGHESCVTSVCYSPDGTRLLSGSQDNTVRQWQSTGGAATEIFRGHVHSVSSVCYSTDGKRILSGSADYTVRQWPSTEGSATEIFRGHEQEVTSVCYNPDGKRILSGSGDKTVRQWLSSGGPATEIFRGHEGSVESVCYSPDGKRILTGSLDNVVCQWLSSGGPATEIFRGHEGSVESVCYSPDGKRILSGSADNTMRQWLSTGGPATEIFSGREYAVTSVCYSPDGKRILSGSEFCAVRQWPSTGGYATESFWGHVQTITSVCYSPDGKHLLSGSRDKTVRQWLSTGGDATEIFRGHTYWVTSVCYSPDGKKFLSGSLDTTACIWDAHCMGVGSRDADSREKTITDPLFTLRGHHAYITCVAWSVNNEIVTGSTDDTIAIWRQLPNSQDDQELWGMVWRSGYKPILAFGCQIDAQTTLSPNNRALIQQRIEEECDSSDDDSSSELSSELSTDSFDSVDSSDDTE